jgi:hypothetical protein
MAGRRISRQAVAKKNKGASVIEGLLYILVELYPRMLKR